MNSYDIHRLYGGIRTASHSIACRDDLEALDHAKKESGENEVEVWNGKRFVARVKQGDAALTEADFQSL